MLESGIITQHDLARKYANELHANEIMLLAYYIAAVNIEATYHGIIGGDYAPFEGIVLTDTFQMTEHGDTLDTKIFTGNNDRAMAQLNAPITVIVGNPPYSVGQDSANDNNANIKYPALDAAIERTYVARSTATNKNSLYDSYIRAIRWASDRIGEAGVVAYVTNGGWIEANSASGIRISLAKEFSSLYVFNLRGNQRTSGEQSRKEGGKIFGSGSRNTVAILVAAKNPDHTEACRIHYHDIGDCLSREDKLQIVDHASLASINWQTVEPNTAGDWINQRNSMFIDFPAMAIEKNGGTGATYFSTRSGGLSTSRDAWCFNFKQERLIDRVQSMIRVYNEQVHKFGGQGTADRLPLGAESDTTKISWGQVLLRYLKSSTLANYDSTSVRVATYRPFTKTHCYIEKAMVHSAYRLREIFPTPEHENFGIYVNGVHASSSPAALMLNTVPCLDMYGKGGQFFPRWTYESVSKSSFQLELGVSEKNFDKHGYRRIDNITDDMLASHRGKHGNEVTKDDIFYYVYGLLHSPNYRTKFAADLTKMLPRIPLVESSEDYRAFVSAGQELADLHLHYEELEPYPLGEEIAAVAPSDPYELYQVTKMKWKDRQSKTALVYNSWLTLTGFPKEAHQYVLGSRSGVEWLIDRYQVKTDSKSGITNDPNDWALEHHDPTYIRDLVGRIVTLSVETMAIVKSLPALTF